MNSNKVKLYMAARVVLILAAIAYVYVLLGGCDGVHNMSDIVKEGLAVLILASVVLLASNRNYYLPFLGPAAFPATVLSPVNVAASALAESGAAKVNVEVKEADGLYVVWWASNPSGKQDESSIKGPKEAYDKTKNTGVALLTNGVAQLELYCPQTYKVGAFDKVLPKHVHYRVVKENGWMGEVKTVNVTCSPIVAPSVAQ